MACFWSRKIPLTSRQEEPKRTRWVCLPDALINRTLDGRSFPTECEMKQTAASLHTASRSWEVSFRCLPCTCFQKVCTHHEK